MKSLNWTKPAKRIALTLALALTLTGMWPWVPATPTDNPNGNVTAPANPPAHPVVPLVNWNS
jgi:hypothetical protein